jgi:hypothetical protein
MLQNEDHNDYRDAPASSFSSFSSFPAQLPAFELPFCCVDTGYSAIPNVKVHNAVLPAEISLQPPLKRSSGNYATLLLDLYLIYVSNYINFAFKSAFLFSPSILQELQH